MPVFQYVEIDKNGKKLSGNMVAATKMEVVQNIKNKGSKVIHIREHQEKSQDIKDLRLFAPRVKTKDLYLFCKQMHTMLSAGMPLLSAITVLESQTENKTLRKIFLEMQIDLQKGAQLSQAMKKHKQFPQLLLNMVEAGEMSGNLDDVLEKMAVHYEKENRINAKIRGAMVYPIILGLLSVGVVIFILVALMPMFMGMFEDAGIELPGLTRALIAASDFMVARWFVLLGIVIGIVVLIKMSFKTPQGKRNWDRLTMRLPGLKMPIQMIYTSRFTRTLSTLLGSGISILDAFRIAARITNNRIVIEQIDGASEAIKKGEPVSATLAKLRLFPAMMISMITIGEESGSIEEMLGKTADYYDQELDEAIGKLVAMMEPMLIIVMGGLVGISVIAILLPMFDMASTVH